MADRFLTRWLDELRRKLSAYSEHDRFVAGETLPLPSADQIRNVNSHEKADPSVFLRSGVSDLLAIVETLATALDQPRRGAESALPEKPTIMEFGCGLGRLLRHARQPDVAEMIATDVNAESLRWCQTNLPGPVYQLHELRPPIGNITDASVDVIYAHSVFTHIPLERQHVWLRELKRLLRPGGWLLATVLGHEQQLAQLTAAEQEELAIRGAIQVGPDGDPVTMYRAVCQTEAHQHEAFSAVFDICGRKTRGTRQDVLALRRR